MTDKELELLEQIEIQEANHKEQTAKIMYVAFFLIMLALGIAFKDVPDEMSAYDYAQSQTRHG